MASLLIFTPMVSPLLFHSMSQYPYGTEEAYPSDKTHLEYLREYNTRKVTTEDFRRAIVNAKPLLE